MGNKSWKGSSNSAKDNGGCLWSFARVFEFSESYNIRKLLVDRKCGSARYHGTSFLGKDLTKGIWKSKSDHVGNGADGHADTIALSRLPSVKVLIEEEMSKERASKASGCSRKLKHKKTKNNENDSDSPMDTMMNSAHVVLEQVYCREPIESSNNLMFELASLIIEFNSASRYCSETCKEIETVLRGSMRSFGRSRDTYVDESDFHPIFKPQEALVVEAEAFLSQKIDDAKRQDGKGVVRSQEFMDALEILNSNKEMFINLIQDPKSLLLRQFHETLKQQAVIAAPCMDGSNYLEENHKNSNQNWKSISTQIFHQQKQHFISKKKALWSAENSVSSCPPARYTHYREKPVESNERPVSHFSFREIKRKFLGIISEEKKEHHVSSKNSLIRVLNGCKGSSAIDRLDSTESVRINMTSQTVSNNENIYLPFLAFDSADRNAQAKKGQLKAETDASQSKIQGLQQIPFSRMEPINKTASLSSDQSSKAIPQLSCDFDEETTAEKGGVCLQDDGFNGEQPDLKERKKVVEIENIRSVHINPAECHNVYIPVALIGSENGFSSESCKEGSSTQSEQGTPNEKPRIMIPTASVSPSSLIINHSEITDEKQDRPSPVSVLEQFFIEDDTNPDFPRIIFDELHEPLQPIYLSFHEDPAVLITTSNSLMASQRICSYDMNSMIENVRNMLESVSFDSEISAERCSSSELLLQPLLLDEVRTSHSEFFNLLLDYVNEVFLDSKDKQTQTFPWVTFIKQKVQPTLKNALIEEVCKNIATYLSSQTQSSLNEIMRIDMDRTMWMDHRLEMGCIIEGLGCSICEELVEETINEIFLIACN